MVEEANSGCDAGEARSIEVHGNLDVGLLGLALDRGAAHEECFPEVIRARKRGRCNRPGLPSLQRDGARASELPPMVTKIWPRVAASVSFPVSLLLSRSGS